MKVDNWRWAGVPFFLRSGKRLARRVSEIAVEFKQPPLHLFRYLGEDNDDVIGPHPMSNVIVMRIQPDEGISLSIACKQPGMRIQLQEVEMDFFYGEAFHERSPEAYERLLLDSLRGDARSSRGPTRSSTRGASSPRSTRPGRICRRRRFPNYYRSGDGPDEANRLLEGTQARWRPLATWRISRIARGSTLSARRERVGEQRDRGGVRRRSSGRILSSVSAAVWWVSK
jgi:glucose-6-phosphate 1-dehydrogenase